MTAELERRLLNYTRAAAYLGVSLRTMKELGGPQGSIARVTIANRVLFDKTDLDRYIDAAKKAS